MSRSLFLYFFLLQLLFVNAQPADSPPVVSPYKNFTFIYDNDFFNATDMYYTQGVIVSLTLPVLRYSPVFYSLLKLPASARLYSIALEQDVFTPRSIRYQGGAVYYGERPFTALMYLSHTLFSISEKQKLRLSSRIDIGFMGPAALGKEEQKAIHEALNNIEPLGWDNQLSQDLVLNYLVSAEKGLVMKKYFDLVPSAGVRLGMPYTDVTCGVLFRGGWFDDYFNDGTRIKAEKKFRTWAFIETSIKAVAYNATLQGGIINGDNIYTLPAESVQRIVGRLNLGINVRIKKLTLQYMRSFITPEFSGGLSHGWGRCVIGVDF